MKRFYITARVFFSRLYAQPSEAGFTLIETFVAITILLTAIAGPLTIASKGLSSALLAKDQITAFFLAQDAIEHIRFVRDSNVLAGNSWLAGLESCVGGSCPIDAKESTISSCPGGTCPTLRYDDETAFYGYSLADPLSEFTRTVTITAVDAKEVSINVTVAWTTGVFNRSLTVREHLLDWSSVSAAPLIEGTPTFWTLLPPSYAQFTVAAGNLQVNRSGAGSNAYQLFSSLPQSGKWYFEVKIDSYSSSPQPQIGIIGSTKNLGDGYTSQSGDGFVYNVQGGHYVNDTYGSTGSVNFGSAGSVIGIAYDADNGRVWIGGATSGGSFAWLNRGGATPNPASGTNAFATYSGSTGARRLTIANSNNGGSWQMTFNFGQGSISGTTYYASAGGSFRFAPPTGFFALLQ